MEATKRTTTGATPMWRDEREVEFEIHLPGANEVYLAGEFSAAVSPVSQGSDP